METPTGVAPVEVRRGMPNTEGPRVVRHAFLRKANEIHQLQGKERSEAMRDPAKSEISFYGKLTELSTRPDQTFVKPVSLKEGQPLRLVADGGNFRLARPDERSNVITVTALTGVQEGKFLCRSDNKDMGIFDVSAQTLLDAQLAAAYQQGKSQFGEAEQTIIETYIEAKQKNSGDFSMNSIDNATLKEAEQQAQIFTTEDIQSLVDTKYANSDVPDLADDATEEQTKERDEIIQKNQANSQTRQEIMNIFKGTIPTPDELAELVQHEGLDDTALNKLGLEAKKQVANIQELLDTKKVGDKIPTADGGERKITQEDLIEWRASLEIAQAQAQALSSGSVQELFNQAFKVIESGAIGHDDTRALIQHLLNQDYDEMAALAVDIATTDQAQDAESRKRKLLQKEALKERLKSMGKMGGMGGGVAAVMVVILMMQSLKETTGGQQQ